MRITSAHSNLQVDQSAGTPKSLGIQAIGQAFGILGEGLRLTIIMVLVMIGMMTILMMAITTIISLQNTASASQTQTFTEKGVHLAT